MVAQEETKEKLRSTSSGLETLGEKLIRYSEINTGTLHASENKADPKHVNSITEK